MRVALGADHAGFDLKERLKRLLDELHVSYEDLGCWSPDPVDYPDIAVGVTRKVADGSAERGILICGTGIGMAIAANKVRGIRAAPACSIEAVTLARRHNDLNVLTLGGRTMPADAACVCVRTFLETPFDGGRHQRRLDKITALESGSVLSSEDHPSTTAPQRGCRAGDPASSGRAETAEPRSPKSDV